MEQRKPVIIDELLVLVVFAALPTIGLVNGPAYAPFLFIMGALRIIIARGRVPGDVALIALWAAFSALCWASCLWSIVPEHSASGAAQAMAVLGAAMFVFAGPPAPSRLVPVLAWAVLAGVAVMLADRASGDRLLHMVSVHPGATKYNRGIDYMLLLVIPLLGMLAQEKRWRLVVAVTVAVTACVAAGKNTTVWVALPGAILVALADRRAPRWVPRVIGGAVVASALALPVALRALSVVRPALAPHLKESLLKRLEIWDYMSARVMERPLSGWGIWSSKSVPITAEELSHYVRDKGESIYPHNQWLELWVETGLLGAVLAAGLVVLVLWRIRRMPPGLQPFACATVFLALMISLTSFEFTTDSWWAALAASALLFKSSSRIGEAEGKQGEGLLF